MTQFVFLYLEYKIICQEQPMVKYLPDGLSLALRLIFRIFSYVIAYTLNLNETILHACTI